MDRTIGYGPISGSSTLSEGAIYPNSLMERTRDFYSLSEGSIPSWDTISFINAGVAQQAEQRTCNARVGGSIPSTSSTNTDVAQRLRASRF